MTQIKSGYGVGAPSIDIFPPIQEVTSVPPSTNKNFIIGQEIYIRNTPTSITVYTYNGGGTWTATSGPTSVIDTINSNAPIAGNYVIAGTTNQITKTDTAGTTTLSIPSAFTAPGSITSTTTIASGTTLTGGTGITATTGNISASAGAVNAATSMTATLGDITATNGNFVSTTAGKGLSFNANTATGAAASPVVLNSRAGQVVFSSVSIAAAADLTLTITNSAITGSSTQVMHAISGATTGSAISVKSKTASAGSIAFVITNATGATTTTADITITFIVVN